MSELNAQGVADEARRNNRDKMPAPSPLVAFRVDVDPLTLMLTCLNLAGQVTVLRKACLDQVFLTASAEEWGRRWRERMKELERDKADLVWENKQLKQRLGEA